MSAGKAAAAIISFALAAVIPLFASTGILASFSGAVCATSSISIPPETEAITKKVRFERSNKIAK